MNSVSFPLISNGLLGDFVTVLLRPFWGFYLRILWLLALLKFVFSLFRREEILRSVARNLSWLFCLAVSLLINNSLLVYSLPLSLNSFSSFAIETDAWVRKETDGCRERLTPTKKSKSWSSLLFGLLCGSFCRVLNITFFKLTEIDGLYGNE